MPHNTPPHPTPLAEVLRSLGPSEARVLAPEAVRLILRSIGEDPDREGLLDTPRRYLSLLDEVTTREEFSCTTFEAEAHGGMIVQRGITFWSLCEHHMAPFFGTATVAYIPGDDGRIVGLSKLARAVRYFAAGLQNQERISDQTADYLVETLEPKGAAVQLTARHLCMEMRGVRASGAQTITTALRGGFLASPETRGEFLMAARGSNADSGL